MITLDENEARLIIQALEGMTIVMSLQGAAALAAVRLKLTEQLAAKKAEDNAGVLSPAEYGAVLADEAEAFRDNIPYTPRVAKTNGHDPIEIDGKHV
jgi:hypothetical protein